MHRTYQTEYVWHPFRVTIHPLLPKFSQTDGKPLTLKEKRKPIEEKDVHLFFFLPPSLTGKTAGIRGRCFGNQRVHVTSGTSGGLGYHRLFIHLP
ncbi:hypothetical protein TNCV_381071 [Trichonephila clavipes]|uniref:Uncharacterized protein n=1 Tax=Trichonephila clavipes TaxID=2585209 RepID=A0A8X6SI54_TRICX|nr:hypothetical protein TNCV_381071 [Trichonephila clavipes]